MQGLGYQGSVQDLISTPEMGDPRTNEVIEVGDMTGSILCPAAGNYALNNILQGTDTGRGVVVDGSQAALVAAGRNADATALGRVAAPASVGLVVFGEGYAAVEDYKQGMSWRRSATIHGTAASGGVAGALAGAALGEAIFPLGGGIPGSIIGGIGGSWGGGRLGGAIATEFGACT